MENLDTFKYKRMVRAKIFMDRQFADDIVLGKISQQAYMSKFHFSRVFKSVYGMSPRNYLTRTRLGKAKGYLAQAYSVKDTCMAVGYQSMPSFKLLFKKVYGMTPWQYRQELLARKKEMEAHPKRFLPHCLIMAKVKK